MLKLLLDVQLLISIRIIATMSPILDTHRYAGLEQGDTCICGNTLSPSFVADTECNIPCSGYNSQNCGGNGVSSTFGLSLTGKDLVLVL